MIFNQTELLIEFPKLREAEIYSTEDHIGKSSVVKRFCYFCLKNLLISILFFMKN